MLRFLVAFPPPLLTCTQGSSYSGGHVLQLGATDKRVKAVSCQVSASSALDVVYQSL